MQCPVDGSVLVMSERSGVEIDYCPQCRGVWLDRGELDKIIQLDNTRHQSQEQTRPNPPRPVYVPEYQDDRYGSGGHHYYPKKKKKHRSIFEELFD